MLISVKTAVATASHAHAGCDTFPNTGWTFELKPEMKLAARPSTMMVKTRTTAGWSTMRSGSSMYASETKMIVVMLTEDPHTDGPQVDARHDGQYVAGYAECMLWLVRKTLRRRW